MPPLGVGIPVPEGDIPGELGRPGRQVGSRGNVHEAALHERRRTQSAQDEGLDLIGLDLPLGALHRGQEVKPVLGFRRIRRPHDTLVDQGVSPGVLQGQGRIGRVPEVGRSHRALGEALEAVGIRAAGVDHEAPGREAPTVAPGEVHALGRKGAEVLQVAGPGPVIVGEEDVGVRPRRLHPARKMHRHDPAQVALSKRRRHQQPDHPEVQGEGVAAEEPRLGPGDREHQVLGVARRVLPGLDFRHPVRRRDADVSALSRFVGQEQDQEDADQNKGGQACHG